MSVAGLWQFPTLDAQHDAAPNKRIDPHNFIFLGVLLPKGHLKTLLKNTRGLPRVHPSDPNGWFANPRVLITAIERIIYVSVEAARIIEELPSEITSD